MNLKKVEENFKSIIFNVLKALGAENDFEEIQFVNIPQNHKTPKFEEGYMYVYSFWCDGEELPLKIGKAGPKGKTLYTSHNYCFWSSKNSLASMIVEDEHFCDKYKFDRAFVSEWMHENCYRLDIKIPAYKGTTLLNLIEASILYVYKTKFPSLV